MQLRFTVALVGAALSTSAFAQVTPTNPVPGQMSGAVQYQDLRLPANTEVLLALNSEISSKSHNIGDKVSMTLVQDVVVGGTVVIPRGTHAVGQVTRLIRNGGFGKSGKIELTFRYIDLNGQQIPLEGSYFQEGRGNTAGTVGAVFAAGVIGGLVVKGHSATIPQGREFSARVIDTVPFVVPGPGILPSLATNYRPTPVSLRVETENERKGRLKAEEKARKAGV